MAENKDLFYLDKVFPEPDKIFSANYKSIDELFKTAIFVFDTNALLVPFDTSEQSLKDIKAILLKLKKQNRFIIPARVAQEFARNRASKLGDLFLSLRQLKNNLNTGTFKINEYPLLDGIESYSQLKENFNEISKQIKKARQNIESLEQSILNWTWNDTVSMAYKEIFTSDVIINLELSENEIEKDLRFRFEHKIPPGFKDSNKMDDGIGDLIIWQTLLQVGKHRNSDIVFISNDEKNDWFHKQDKVGMYPRFELYDEFRRQTNERSFSIISFLKFLQLSNAKTETLEQIKQSLNEPKIDNDPYLLGVQNFVDGLIVEQQKFGIGTIRGIQISEEHGPIADIDFMGFGRKKILVNYASLKVLNNKTNKALLKMHDNLTNLG